jgi:hypothetical protein
MFITSDLDNNISKRERERERERGEREGIHNNREKRE